ncbi:MAG TPA: precorrin-6Y C5,15-methyltransferase (decarboxylating) subunit CbiT, partial [Tissierellaceae bacterium]|nr:precorrin-6Y C5,15-methyltransferase (decarboxylating) subunit CbiT [Tissierellaceae bacterium]
NQKIHTIWGQAPEDLPDKEFNKCFIGGSRGQLAGIFSYLSSNLLEGGIVCANFITLDNLNEFNKLLLKYNYKDIEINLIQASQVNRLGMLKGQNPIFIIKGVKSNA